MTLSVTHAFVSGLSDDPAAASAGQVVPSNWNAAHALAGVASPSQGGTGVDGSSAANGQLLVGNGSGYTLATLTAGSNIVITNSAGGVSVAAKAAFNPVAAALAGNLWAIPY